MSGIRLNFVVEGQTEETFVNHLLLPHLASRSIRASARCVQTGRRRNVKHRGGVVRYAQARGDITRPLWMDEQRGRDVRFTTMFDLCQLPNDFPGYEAPAPDPREQVGALQVAMLDDIGDERLLPYIQLHEFEALVLSAPETLRGLYPDHGSGVSRLVEMAASFRSPESD